MRGLIVLCIIFIGACTAQLDSFSVNADKIRMGSNNVTLFQVDNTIQGAIIRLARYETDRIFVQLGELPAEVDVSYDGDVLQKVLEFCNLSFACEYVDTPQSVRYTDHGMSVQLASRVVRVSTRVFIKAQ